MRNIIIYDENLLFLAVFTEKQVLLVCISLFFEILFSINSYLCKYIINIYKMTIKLKRVYDKHESDDGVRILVDKLWPRGVKKSDIDILSWEKDISPSAELRKMLHENVEDNWLQFKHDYSSELAISAAFSDFLHRMETLRPPVITLLYAFRNIERNNAVVIREEMIKYFSDEIQ